MNTSVAGDHSFGGCLCLRQSRLLGIFQESKSYPGEYSIAGLTSETVKEARSIGSEASVPSPLVLSSYDCV